MTQADAARRRGAGQRHTTCPGTIFTIDGNDVPLPECERITFPSTADERRADPA